MINPKPIIKIGETLIKKGFHKDLRPEIAQSTHSCRYCSRKIKKGDEMIKTLKSEFGHTYSRRRFHPSCYDRFIELKQKYSK